MPFVFYARVAKYECRGTVLSRRTPHFHRDLVDPIALGGGCWPASGDWLRRFAGPDTAAALTFARLGSLDGSYQYRFMGLGQATTKFVHSDPF